MSKCSVLMTLKLKVSYCTLFRPKYCAFIEETVIPIPKNRNMRKTSDLERMGNRMTFLIFFPIKIIIPINYLFLNNVYKKVQFFLASIIINRLKSSLPPNLCFVMCSPQGMKKFAAQATYGLIRKLSLL